MNKFINNNSSYLDIFEEALEKIGHELYPSDSPLHNAVRYALSVGGKRIRPLICMQAAEAVGVKPTQALPAAVAVEMIHTYSLIHDDLPCMDNDDLRRGKPTTHKVFGDDIALLAGDALLTDAFFVLTSSEIAQSLNTKFPALEHIVQQVQLLSMAAGGKGMVYGQACDLFWTARAGAKKDDLDTIHINKTGKLLGSAAALGAAAAGAPTDIINKFKEFGELTGLAFQIKDDLLDSEVGTGKSIGKDAEAGKLTYATTMSREASEKAASYYTSKALASLAATGLQTSRLESTAHMLLERTR
jgi:geranylgeranyl diphosphate synthase type II